MQLNEDIADFEALGLGVACMTYDSQEIQAGFHAEAGLKFPLLQDVDAQQVIAWGILNEEQTPGSRGYGIPHPGVVLISPDGTVLAKYAEPGYRTRPPWDDVRMDIERLLNP